jgi:hypothetical protein
MMRCTASVVAAAESRARGLEDMNRGMAEKLAEAQDELSRHVERALAAESRARAAEGRAERAEKRCAEGEAAYIGSGLCREILGFLEAAGCGKPGTPNTLWAMTQEIIASRDEARAEGDRLRGALRGAAESVGALMLRSEEFPGPRQALAEAVRILSRAALGDAEGT